MRTSARMCLWSCVDFGASIVVLALKGDDAKQSKSQRYSVDAC